MKTKSAAQYKYKIKEMYDRQPRSFSISETLKKVGINRRTFYRDLNIMADDKADVPADRMLKYASMLGVPVEDLYNANYQFINMFGFKSPLASRR